MKWFHRLIQHSKNKFYCSSDPVVPASQEDNGVQPSTFGLLKVVWPPDKESSNDKVFWIAVSNGSEWCPTFIETERSRLVALFITPESAFVVKDALLKSSLVDAKTLVDAKAVYGIRCASGISRISRSEFEKLILESGWPPCSKKYRLVWEDDRLFIGLCCLLKIAVFIKPEFSIENIQQCVREVLE